MRKYDSKSKIKREEFDLLLEVVLDQSPDCITIVDTDGYVVKANKAYETITGISSCELIGIHITELVKMGVIEEALGLLVIKERKPITAIQKLPKTGKEALVTINPVFNQKGELIYIIGSTRDMDALNQLKQELEKSRQENARYKKEIIHLQSKNLKEHDLIFQSYKMKQLTDMVRQIARYDLPVLITGESGTGKEVMARYIHSVSERKDSAFIAINCAALPEHLVESELFGYNSGAFTGAEKNGKMGLFELANNGTLFLDEIGDLPLGAQAKMLRVLEDMNIRRVGGISTKHINVRIIAATNRSLEDEIKEGKFRGDLYYRLSVVLLNIPPLRERREDIPLLVNSFCEQFNKKYNMKKSFSAKAISILEQYNWSGNVREMRNIIERLVVCTSSHEIKASDIYENIGVAYQTESNINNLFNNINDYSSIRSTLNQMESNVFSKALEKYGSTRKAAAALGVSQSTFLRRIKRGQNENNGDNLSPKND